MQDDLAFDPVEFIVGDQRNAMQSVMAAGERPAEEAQRAIEIGRGLDIPAPVVAADFENYDNQYKTHLTSSLLRDNQYLRRYIDNEPMAAQISNDDWAQLDKVSQSVSKFGDGSILLAVGEGFKAGYNWDHMRDEYAKLANYLDNPTWRALIGSAPLIAGAPVAAGVLLDQFTRALTGVAFGAAQGAREIGIQLGQEPAWADRLMRDLIMIADVGEGGAAGFVSRPRVQQVIKEAVDVAVKIQPYVSAGKEIPRGIDPIIDQIHAKQAEMDLKTLEEFTTEASASATRERSPEIFAEFLRQHTDAYIGVSGDAVQKLYGEKAPMADDGILGWVPDIGAQLEEAIATGGDIRIPIADWGARVDPEVAKALRDDIRVRQGGYTKNEAADLGDASAFEQTVEDAQDVVERVRQAAGLKFTEGRDLRTLKLEKGETFKHAHGMAVHAFELRDEQGNAAAHLRIAERPDGEVLYVESIYGLGRNAEPQAFGLRLMRDVLRQVKEAFPNAKELYGWRVSGARAQAGVNDLNAVAHLKLTEPPTPEQIAQFLKGLEPQLLLPKGAKMEGLAPVKGYKKEFPSLAEFTAKEALDLISKDDLTGVPRAIYEFLGEKFKKDIPNVPVKVVSDSDIARLWYDYYPAGKSKQTPIAYYDAAHDHIVVSESLLKGAYGDQKYIRQTLFEEVGHAYSTAALNGDPKLKADADQLLRDTRNWFRENDAEFLEQNKYTFSNIDEFWARGLAIPKVSETLAMIPIEAATAKKLGLGEGVRTVWDAFKYIMRKLLNKLMGVTPTETVLEGLLKIGSRIDERKEGAATAMSALEAELKGSERPPLPADQRDAFDRAAAIGMTVKQYERYQKLMLERQAKDVEIASDRALKEQQKRQTAVWKENEATERAAALESINARPDVSADAYLRHSELFGQKVDRLKLQTDSVSKEIRDRLPRDYFTAKGVKPDDIAPLFGYPDGATMLSHLADFNDIMKSIGKRPFEYKRLLVNLETERRMQEKYGQLADTILDEAIDQVLSETQLNMLHEETLALATQAGSEFSITQAELKKAAQENFSQQPAKAVDVDRYIASAHKAGLQTELALLEDRPSDAFRAKQQQYFSLIYAREAKAFAKDQAALAKTAKRFVKRQVDGVDQQFTNFIHQLMIHAGQKVQRSIQDVQQSIVRDGNTTLSDFVDAQVADGWELDIEPNILDGQMKPLERMTVQEFRDYKDAIDTLAYIGRETQRIEIAGEKRQMAEFRKEVIENIKQLPMRKRGTEESALGKLRSVLYGFDASLVRMEEIMKDLDLRQELGPLWNAVIRPMMDSKHTEYKLQEALAKEFRDIRGFDKEWQRSLNDTIPQDFLMDPRYDGNVPFDLTRANMINIMLNFGNRSNIKKFTLGYGKKDAAKLEAQLWALFDRYATKEDWDFAQKIWDIFEGWKEKADELYHNLSGLSPKWIEYSPFNTRHGTYKGGYFPVIYDKWASNIEAIKDKETPDAMFGKNYYRATTANRYTKDRTGYVDYVQFLEPVETIVARMQQQIHDISYRAAVMNVGKVLYDKQIRAAIRNHYGPEYERQLIPWLKDVANHYNMDEVKLQQITDAMRRMRLNLSGHALGLNLKVILSPDVGALNPRSVMSYLSDRKGARELAYEKSKEIPHSYKNMDRDYREQLDRLIASRGLEGLRADAVRWAFAPLVWVSQHFRIMTFLSKYNEALAKGMGDADAAMWADSFVRERHSSTGVPDLPAVMRSNEGFKMLTVFYGYFSTMYNWQRQIPDAARRGDMRQLMTSVYGSILITAAFGALLFNKKDKDDSWFEFMAKSLALAPLQTLPFIREAASFIFEGYPSRSPWEGMVQAFEKGGRDIVKAIQGKKIEKPIQDTANVLGLGLGIPAMGQIGRTSQFLYDVNKRKQKPRNIGDWIRGIIFGEVK